MKISSQILVLFLSVILVGASGCVRHRAEPPAEVVYRTPLPNGTVTGGVTTGGVTVNSEPQHPNLPDSGADLTIGLIVPLTGQHAAIGEQLRDAALMGLYNVLDKAPKLDRNAVPKLVIKDNASDAQLSFAAAQELVAEGAEIVIGPLLADNVLAAAQATVPASIPLIAFSNNIDIAKPDVYVFGFTPIEQVTRIANYTANQQIKHYTAIAPQDEYGRMVVRDFAASLQPYGANLQPVEFYTKTGLPEASVLNRVSNQLATWGKQRKALLLPMIGKPLSATAYRIIEDENANNGFLKILGTGLWDNPESLNDPILRGAWFATTSPDLSYRYNERFLSEYNYAPSRVASLAYDAVSMMAMEVLELSSDAFTESNLTREEGFFGSANGRVRFLENGRVQRELAVVEVGSSGFKVIDTPRFLQ